MPRFLETRSGAFSFYILLEIENELELGVVDSGSGFVSPNTVFDSLLICAVELT